ncbi:Uncharacterized protein Rs2_44417 [Raphanus sativus]|nr:Uncharacterized protein Rs2_44417 [Raphanus sativus]
MARERIPPPEAWSHDTVERGLQSEGVNFLGFNKYTSLVTHGALSAAGLVNHGVVVSSVRCVGGWDALELNFARRHAYHKESAGVKPEVMACGSFSCQEITVVVYIWTLRCAA